MSAAFKRLHHRVQQWVYDQGWTNLRRIQEEAIGAILDGSDVIVSAPTAGGKTEAAMALQYIRGGEIPATAVEIVVTSHRLFRQPQFRTLGTAANVICAGIQTANATVFVIDRLLLPPMAGDLVEVL